MTQQINLLNRLSYVKTVLFSTQSLSYALLLLVAFLGSMYGYLSYKTSMVRAQWSQVERLYGVEQQRMALMLNQTRFVTPEKQAELQEIERMKQALVLQKQLQVELQKVGVEGLLLFSPYMEALSRQVVAGLSLTGFEVHKRTASAGVHALSISGDALNGSLVTHFIQQLRQEPVMKGSVFSLLNIEDKQADDHHYVHFQIESSVESRP
ncbi:MAG: PilN domain-containing protein [Zetaproteobacteria bacterium]|nr:PilN domain-containing protein [Zetaproteobacteria bacterium]